MNISALTAGARVYLVHNTPDHAHDRVAPQHVTYLGHTPTGAVVESRGRVDTIRWDDPDWYIADVHTLSAFVVGDEDEAPLPTTRAEAE
jgi:hypothetical protein